MVTDSFYFVRQPLPGNGTVTARLTALDGSATPGIAGGTSALQPWAKAGIIIKASLRQGSAYAAMMVTGSHGVRMQYDYTQRHRRTCPAPCPPPHRGGCGWSAPATRSPGTTPPTARTGPWWAPPACPG